MKVLGITGGTGCGKTTLLHQVEALGGCVIDCDEVYHRLLETDHDLLAAIDCAFPGVVQDGVLQRRKLGKVVFGDEAALQRLNALVHPFIIGAVEQRLKQAQQDGRPLAAIDAVGLVESGLGQLCDGTVAVTAPAEDRVRRLMAREGIDEDYARLRIAAQKSDSEFAAQCTWQIHNNYATAADFATVCGRWLHQWLGGTIMSEMDWKAVRETLLHNPKQARLDDKDKEELNVYCKDYMQFMDRAKTEREAVEVAVEAARAAGFVEFNPEMQLRPGDKVYCVNRKKAVSFVVIGKKPLDKGTRMVIAHTDSPRLDLKPVPLYEEGEIAYFKTHYYGGIKKYQWPTVPLALHGILALTDGSVLKVNIGEDDNDPVFCVSDLLVHLSGEQMKKTLSEGITGEQLNVILGTRPLDDDDGDSNRIKLAIMMLLHDKYGITEEDFLSAELTMVPALKAREVGLDRSLIGAYGHDDRVCAYAGFYPMLHMQEAPEHTSICIFADKEEIGSEGVTGIQSQDFETMMEDLCACQKVSVRRCLGNSICFSADVTAAYDPSFSEVFDRRNSAMLNHGIALCKYTGSRGKAGASDAAGEVMARFRRAFQRGGVAWQVCEMGKVDAGGGGTVAKYMAARNIDTLDAGVPVLSMHAPWELVSKVDCFMTMKACRVFYHMD